MSSCCATVTSATLPSVILAQRGLIAPRDISLMCLAHSQMFKWIVPAITHIDWNMSLVERHLLNWFSKEDNCEPDRRMLLMNVKLVEGGTIGPAPNPGMNKKW